MFRTRERRHVVPRRDHRDADRYAGAPLARSRNRAFLPRRRRQRNQYRRAGSRREQSRPAAGGRVRTLARGSDVSPVRHSQSPFLPCAIGTTTRCCSREMFLSNLNDEHEERKASERPAPRNAILAVSLAGQRARAEERHSSRVRAFGRRGRSSTSTRPMRLEPGHAAAPRRPATHPARRYSASRSQCASPSACRWTLRRRR